MDGDFANVQVTQSGSQLLHGMLVVPQASCIAPWYRPKQPYVGQTSNPQSPVLCGVRHDPASFSLGDRQSHEKDGIQMSRGFPV